MWSIISASVTVVITSVPSTMTVVSSRSSRDQGIATFTGTSCQWAVVGVSEATPASSSDFTSITTGSSICRLIRFANSVRGTPSTSIDMLRNNFAQNSFLDCQFLIEIRIDQLVDFGHAIGKEQIVDPIDFGLQLLFRFGHRGD